MHCCRMNEIRIEDIQAYALGIVYEHRMKGTLTLLCTRG